MKLCMGCMNQIEDGAAVCPLCGFDEKNLRQESYYLDPGTIVGGKYIVGRVLKYGGHTISYIGYDAENERKVIVKEYLPSDFSTRAEGEKEVTIYSGDAQVQYENGLTSFLNEANRIEQLKDIEGIAKVYDCLAENDTGYVISEYLEGRTLKTLLDSGKKYRVDEAAGMIRQILGGLRKVHPLDIIHCDISPETIMVLKDGNIRLTDFGSTRYVTTANSKSLAIILKQGYAPEEQYRSKGKRGPWTDVYALAAVMYRMITGVVPQESVERTLEDNLQEPSKLGTKIPGYMENALMNALNVYAEDRTQSAEEFLNELNNKNTKRKKVKIKSRETGKFPGWAKVLIACLALVICAGSFTAYHFYNKNVINDAKSSDISMPDLTGKSEEEAKAEIDELNKENGWEIEFKKNKVAFNKDADGVVVVSQSLSVGATLNPELDEDSTSVNLYGTDEKHKLVWDGEKLTGTIYYGVECNDEIRYSELNGLNAIAMAQKLGGDGWVNDKKKFIKKKDEERKYNYWDLCAITLADGTTITSADLENSDNQTETIKVADISSISYYGSKFIYIDPLDNYVGEKVSDLPKFDLCYYDKNDESKRVVSKQIKITGSDSLVDYTYYSFTESKGTIVKQELAAGETYDGSDKDAAKVALFDVVKKKLSYSGIGTSVRAKIAEELGYSDMTQIMDRIKLGGSQDESQEITGVTITNADGETVDYFSDAEKDEITITLICAEPPVETSANSGGSGYSGGGNSSDGESTTPTPVPPENTDTGINDVE